MKNSLAKITLYLYPINLKLAGVFNAGDPLILKSIKFSYEWLYIFGAILILMILSAFQVVFYDREITSNVLYVPFKMALIFAYFNVYVKNNSVRINKSMICLSFLPLFISIAGFLLPEINAIIVSFYGVSDSETWRYGGVFGQDVNSLGMYSTLSLILLYISRRALIINLFELILGVFICLACIVVSGMRSGLIALIVTFFVMAFFNSELRRRIFKAALYIVPFIFILIFIANMFIDESYYTLLESRFSLDTLLRDFDSDEDGNLAAAISYLGSVVRGGFDPCLIMFGYDSSLIFVDNFFIFLFLKYGVVGVFLTVCFFIYSYRKAKIWDFKNNSTIGLFFIVYTAIVSLKGIFPIAGYYVFFIIMSMSIISQKENL